MHTRNLKLFSLVAVLVLAVSLFGASVAGAQSATTSVKITATEFKFDPAQITVPLNTPVQFTVTNAGKVEHNVKFELPSAGIEQTIFAQNLKPGETRTASFTFTKAGSWEMYCPVDDHEGAGMKGTVMVLAAQGSSQGSASSSQGASPSTLPKTGGTAAPLAWALAAIGLAGLAAGLRLNRRPARR